MSSNKHLETEFLKTKTSFRIIRWLMRNFAYTFLTPPSYEILPTLMLPSDTWPHQCLQSRDSKLCPSPTFLATQFAHGSSIDDVVALFTINTSLSRNIVKCLTWGGPDEDSAVTNINASLRGQSWPFGGHLSSAAAIARHTQNHAHVPFQRQTNALKVVEPRNEKQSRENKDARLEGHDCYLAPSDRPLQVRWCRVKLTSASCTGGLRWTAKTKSDSIPMMSFSQWSVA